MKRTCKQVTISISKLKKAFHEFGSNLDSADSDNIKNLVQESEDLKEMVLETQREVISPVRSFLKELEKPGVIEKIRAIVEQERGDGERFRLVSALFDKLPSGLIFDDTVYKDFLEEIGFDSNYATDIINECERISDDFNYDIINHLNSVFLNKFMKSDSVLTMDDLPPRLSYYGFGSYLEKGTIKLKNAKRGLGHGAKKTTFIAERTGDHPGVASQDCRFSIGEISGSIEELGRRTRIECQEFSGKLHSCQEKATISVNKEFRGDFGLQNKNISMFCNRSVLNVYNYNPSNTFISNDAKKVFVTDTPGVTLLKHKLNDSKRSYYYDDSSRQYIPMKDSEQPPKVLDNPAEIATEVLDFEGNGIGIIDDYSGFADNQNPCIQITHGILVLRKLDDRFPVGEGTSGGAIIIDVPKLSPEEAKQKISKNRPGGLILMRMRDQNDPGTTKLIDLENDSLETPLDM